MKTQEQVIAELRKSAEVIATTPRYAILGDGADIERIESDEDNKFLTGYICGLAWVLGKEEDE